MRVYCSGILGGGPPRDFCFWFYIACLQNVRNLCFHDFSWFSETSGMVPELVYKNVPESLYIENMGIMLPRVSWCVKNFGHFTTLFQCDLRCKMCLAKYNHRYLICVKSLPTPWLNMRIKLAWPFLSTNKNSPLKIPFLGIQVHRICMLCMFRCADAICREND